MVATLFAGGGRADPQSGGEFGAASCNYNQHIQYPIRRLPCRRIQTTGLENGTLEFLGGRQEKNLRQEGPGSTISTEALPKVSSLYDLPGHWGGAPKTTPCNLMRAKLAPVW